MNFKNQIRPLAKVIIFAIFFRDSAPTLRVSPLYETLRERRYA